MTGYTIVRWDMAACRKWLICYSQVPYEVALNGICVLFSSHITSEMRSISMFIPSNQILINFVNDADVMTDLADMAPISTLSAPRISFPPRPPRTIRQSSTCTGVGSRSMLSHSPRDRKRSLNAGWRSGGERRTRSWRDS